MAVILTIIAAKAAECLVDPVLHQLQYLTKYNDNIEGLQTQVEKLGFLRDGVNQTVAAAHRNGDDIRDEIKMWLSNVDAIIVEFEKLKDEIKHKQSCLFNGLCPNLIFRYRTSRKATKKTFDVISLQEQGKFARVSIPLHIELDLSSKDFIDFDSRKSVMSQITEALNDKETVIIGLYGDPGVGKTALAKEIGKKVKQQKLFDEVMLGVVSKKSDLKVIQAQLSDQLGLKLKEEGEQGRAGRLYARIKQEDKILVILDDVNKTLGLLNDIGIPLDHKGCKVLVATRYEHVCSAIGRQTRKIQVNVLKDEESRILFHRIAGVAVDSRQFSNVGKAIVKECGGLPSVIVTIGRRLRGKGINEWNDVAKELIGKSRATKKRQVDQDDILSEYDY